MLSLSQCRALHTIAGGDDHRPNGYRDADFHATEWDSVRESLVRLGMIDCVGRHTYALTDAGQEWIDIERAETDARWAEWGGCGWPEP